MEIRQILKRHSIAVGHPVPEGCAEERPQGPAAYFDKDNFVALFIPDAGADLTELAWIEGEKRVASNDPNQMPPEITPWIERAQELAPDLREFRSCLITTNMPPTPAHTDSWTDQGIEPGRVTVIFGYTEGEFTGGEYVLAEYGLAFDLRDGAMLVSGTQILHGNMPRDPEEGDYRRRTVMICLDGQPTKSTITDG
jgi:hypothetical protein